MLKSLPLRDRQSRQGSLSALLLVNDMDVDEKDETIVRRDGVSQLCCGCPLVLRQRPVGLGSEYWAGLLMLTVFLFASRLLVSQCLYWDRIGKTWETFHYTVQAQRHIAVHCMRVSDDPKRRRLRHRT